MPIQSPWTANVVLLQIKSELMGARGFILTPRSPVFLCVCVRKRKRRVCKKVFLHQICSEEMPVFLCNTPHIPTESYVGGSTNASMDVFFLCLIFFFRGNYKVQTRNSRFSAQEVFVYILRLFLKIIHVGLCPFLMMIMC